jgi:hypothetical protein
MQVVDTLRAELAGLEPVMAAATIQPVSSKGAITELPLAAGQAVAHTEAAVAVRTGPAMGPTMAAGVPMDRGASES